MQLGGGGGGGGGVVCMGGCESIHFPTWVSLLGVWGSRREDTRVGDF